MPQTPSERQLGVLEPPDLPAIVLLRGERCANDPRCHNRWHFAIPPVATARPGDVVIFGTRDAFDHSLDRNSTPADVVALNLNLVHPLTGPLYVQGAQAGDVLEVTLLDVAPDSFGYTIIVPGFGRAICMFGIDCLVTASLTTMSSGPITLSISAQT